MPTIDKYYPPLSDLVTFDRLPDQLDFIRDGIEGFFGHIFYDNLFVSASDNGSSAFYSLDLISARKLAIEIPGTGINMVLNPDDDPSDISTFPITVFWEWEILGYLDDFDFKTFSFSLEDFFKLGTRILEIDEETFLELALRAFVEPITGTAVSRIEQFVSDINNLFGTSIAVPVDSEDLYSELIESISEAGIESSYVTIFALYIATSDIDTTRENLNYLFSSFLPDDIEEYLSNLLVPKARATLSLSLGLEFPRNILLPVTEQGQPIPGVKSTFVFPKADFRIDTQAGIGYELEFAGSLQPPFASIANTGLIIQIESLKIDLSKKTNITEADLDGRPIEFTGVYARAISVTLPSKWFHEVEGRASNTLRIGAYNLLVGTGGISGTILLETVPALNGGQITDYYFSHFSLNYPVTIFKKNGTAGTIEEVVLQDNNALLAVLNANLAVGYTSTFRFPLSLTTTAGEEKTFDNIGAYQKYLSTLSSDNILWKRLGQNGFKVGFSKFDITFKYDKIVSSNIKGSLVIPNFKDARGNEAIIDVTGHLFEDGDFNLTAAVEAGIALCLGDEGSVFKVLIKSLSIGRNDEKIYLEVAGDLDFSSNPIVSNFLKSPIEIKKLRIYSDGSFEIEGGSIPIPASIPLNLGPVEVNITNITLGSEKLNQGDYKFIGFDCGVSTGSGGLDLRGDGVKVYFNHDGSDMFLRIAGIGIDLIIPGSADEDTAALILKGYLSMRESEYTGAVSFKLPKAKIAGGAAMKMQPKIPAFVVDAFVELSTPLPLGPTGLGIYEFRGLFGLRYIADLPSGATSNPDKMFDFYTAKKPNPLTNTEEKGLHLGKIVRPENAPEDDEGFKKSGTPISIGAGLSLGTTSDAGRAFSLQAFLFLSLPEFFMISGKGNVLGERVKIISEKEPPFFGYMAITREYISIGLGAEYKVRQNEGQFLELNAEAQLAFFFNDASAWYVHFGTKAEPIQAKVLKKIFNLNAYAYLMLSAAGIETGAGIKFEMHKKYGPVKVDVSAYGDVYAMISFRKPQVGGGIACGGRINASAFGVGFDITLDAYLMLTAPRPFIVKGGASVCVEVNLRVKKWRKCVDLEFKWEIDSNIDTSEIKIIDTVPFPVSGYHIGSQNTYKLTYFGSTLPLPGNTVETVPLDTFIDIQLKKPVDPTTIKLVTGGVSNPIGGVSNPPANNRESVPPKWVETQVNHQFEIKTIGIMVWNTELEVWQEYNPYKALDPGAFLQNVDISKLKIGSWQKKGKEYNNLRLLATSPFSYADNMTGGFLPEQMGLTAASLFCEGKEMERHCIGWNEGETYGVGRWHSYQNITFNVTKFDAEVVTFTNVFDIPRSLRIDNRSKLEIILPEKCLETNFTLYSYARKLSVSFYDLQDIPIIQNGVERNQAEYVLIDERVLSLIDYMAPVTFNSDTQTIKKIVIEAARPSIETVHSLTNELHELVQLKLEANNQVSEEVELRIDEVRENLEALEAETCNSNTQEEDLADITGLIETLQAQIVDLRTEIEQIEQEINENCEPVPVGEICEELNRQLEEKLEELRNTEELVERLERLYDIVLNEEPEQIDRCSTYLQQVCYLTQPEQWYNQAIPSQEMIDADYDAFSDTVRKVIAPIWRPDETYAVEIVTKETINGGSHAHPYYFAFKTAGPIGHFPLKFLSDDLKRQYGLDSEGMPANTDTSFSKDVEIPENALKFYIDYDKSYPNPIGNIINQKPLFYNDPNLLIFYTEPYVYHFFSNWPNYDSLGEKLASMRIEVKDPSEQLQPVEGIPPVLTVMPSAIVDWKIDQTPPVKQSIEVMNNLRNPVDFNGTTCWQTGGDPIVPASKNTEIEVENLKPSKLYNVNVFSRYSRNGSGPQEKQIHSYPFQTSRYADLNAQVNSYHLKDFDFNTGQLLSSGDAIYKLSYSFDNLGITLGQLQDIVLGNDVAGGFRPNLIQNYPEALQRLLLGYLQQAPLPPALNTELNMLADADDRLFGIWVRNPEPFNDPRIPLADLRNSVGLFIDEERVTPINPLFSKDRSEILILHEDLSKPAEMVNLSFAYLVWNGTVYIQDQSVTTKNLI